MTYDTIVAIRLFGVLSLFSINFITEKKVRSKYISMYNRRYALNRNSESYFAIQAPALPFFGMTSHRTNTIMFSKITTTTRPHIRAKA